MEEDSNFLSSRRYLCRAHSASRGIALISVVWVLLLLTLIVGSAASLALSQKRFSESSRASLQDELTLDGAIKLSLLAAISNSAQIAPEPFASREWAVNGSRIFVQVSAESGRIDLNHAPAEIIEAVLAANGLEAGKAKDDAERIVRWRTLSDSSSAESVATGDMRRSAFQVVEDVRRAVAPNKLTPAMLALFTVYSHAEVPQWQKAPPGVLAATGWLLNYSRDYDYLARSELSQPSDRAVSPMETVRLKSCMPNQAAALCRQAVVRLTGTKDRPYMVFAWQSVPP